MVEAQLNNIYKDYEMTDSVGGIPIPVVQKIEEQKASIDKKLEKLENNTIIEEKDESGNNQQRSY